MRQSANIMNIGQQVREISVAMGRNSQGPSEKTLKRETCSYIYVGSKM